MKIKNIFITHAHFDHLRSIPFFTENIIVRNLDHRVNILSIYPVLKVIKKHLFNISMWPDFTIISHPDNAIVNLIELKPRNPLKIDNISVTPYEVNHTVPSVGYMVEDKMEKSFFILAIQD